MLKSYRLTPKSLSDELVGWYKEQGYTLVSRRPAYGLLEGLEFEKRSDDIDADVELAAAIVFGGSSVGAAFD